MTDGNFASDLVIFGVDIDKLNDIANNVVLPQLSNTSSGSNAMEQ